ncbi:MAG: ribosome maturation factor RimP [Firmicutes bacterium]|nr:ribosome maturation factor RimP [Bacillota bacterium]
MANNKVAALVEKLVTIGLADMGIELVDVTYGKEGGRWFLRIFIDQPGGIGLEDCQRVSEYIDPLLDEHDPIPNAYTLEVSSPGIERPLKKTADFERFTGRQISLNTFAAVAGKRKFKGLLKMVDNQAVTLEVDGEQLIIPMEQIASAKLVAEF